MPRPGPTVASGNEAASQTLREKWLTARVVTDISSLASLGLRGHPQSHLGARSDDFAAGISSSALGDAWSLALSDAVPDFATFAAC